MRSVAFAFTLISALFAWVAAYWGIPSGALALSSALCCSIVVSPPRNLRLVVLLCLACVISGTVATYFWNQAWSPDAPGFASGIHKRVNSQFGVGKAVPMCP